VLQTDAQQPPGSTAATPYTHVVLACGPSRLTAASVINTVIFTQPIFCCCGLPSTIGTVLWGTNAAAHARFACPWTSLRAQAVVDRTLTPSERRCSCCRLQSLPVRFLHACIGVVRNVLFSCLWQTALLDVVGPPQVRVCA
jgi:hypothetical protein